MEDYKEKYEMALERARQSLTYPDMPGFMRVDVIFPELKESKDEMIRNLIYCLIRDRSDNGKLLEANGCSVEDALAWLKKQGEQKHADKVEPKFKVGDWIVSDNNNVAYIESISETKYNLQCKDGYHEKMSIEYVDRCWHLWTINDAKDGDVLVASGNSIFLFKGTIDCACKHYVALTTDGAVKFNEGLEHYWETARAVHPATKEQHDILEKAITEAGYEWNAEKKKVEELEKKLKEK